MRFLASRSASAADFFFPSFRDCVSVVGVAVGIQGIREGDGRYFGRYGSECGLISSTAGAGVRSLPTLGGSIDLNGMPLVETIEEPQFFASLCGVMLFGSNATSQQ